MAITHMIIWHNKLDFDMTYHDPEAIPETDKIMSIHILFDVRTYFWSWFSYISVGIEWGYILDKNSAA